MVKDNDYNFNNATDLGTISGTTLRNGIIASIDSQGYFDEFDVYKFNLPNPGKFTAILRPSTTDTYHNTDLELYDVNGNLIGYSYNAPQLVGAVNPNEKISLDLKAGTYYVRVWGRIPGTYASKNGNNYSLSLESASTRQPSDTKSTITIYLEYSQYSSENDGGNYYLPESPEWTHMDVGNGNNSLRGNSFNNYIKANGGDDTIFGYGGDDGLIGGDGNDFINGGKGNDYFFGNNGDDTLIGGDGNDKLHSSLGVDHMNGGSGIDTVIFKESNSSLIVDLAREIVTLRHDDSVVNTLSSIENVEGSSESDILLGDNKNNNIYGHHGSDSIKGLGGDDTLTGGADNDTIEGNDGNDTLQGDTGNDFLSGGKGNDYLHVDSYIEDLGDDTVYGGEGNDEIIGLSGRDIFVGNEGNDVFILATANYIQEEQKSKYVPKYRQKGDDDYVSIPDFTKDEDKILISHDIPNYSLEKKENTLFNSSNKIITEIYYSGELIAKVNGDIELNSDYFIFAQVDTADYSTAKAPVFADLNLGTATAKTAQGTTEEYTLVSINQLYGSNFDDNFIGDAKENILIGGVGNDSLMGGAGNDNLRGDVGADTLDGGEGIDRVAYWTAIAGVIADLNLGTATTTDAQGNTEQDTLVSIEQVFGSNFDDTLIGDAKENILVGGVGNDSLIGGSGNDNLRGDIGADTLDGGEGIDRVAYWTATVGVTADLNLGTATTTNAQGNTEQDTLISIEQLFGSNFNDRFVGDDQSNAIITYDGDDTLTGGKGDDILEGGNGADIFAFAAPDQGVDRINDFNSTEGDKIQISASGFGANLIAGPLNADQFVLGTASVDANDRFIFNQDTGRLSFDADGSGVLAAVELATFHNNAVLSHTDIFVV